MCSSLIGLTLWMDCTQPPTAPQLPPSALPAATSESTTTTTAAQHLLSHYGSVVGRDSVVDRQCGREKQCGRERQCSREKQCGRDRQCSREAAPRQVLRLEQSKSLPSLVQGCLRRSSLPPPLLTRQVAARSEDGIWQHDLRQCFAVPTRAPTVSTVTK